MIPLGCDTLVALSNATADGSVILAKNSDRPADESQPLIQAPRVRHPRGSRLKCQYLEIPQGEEALAFIGSRPHWLWGLEHGMNECGVAIGNEAVFTKEALPEKGLLGMDLVRLGLERGHTAREALQVMTSLLEEFGQGGSAFEHVQWQYNNSFLIADYSEAYILEASGQQYAWKKVSEVASVSNHIAIGADWSGLSNDAISHAASNGWWQRDSSEGFDFAKAYRTTDVAPPQISEDRLRQSQEFLDEYRKRISPETMMRILRDHYESGTVFTPGRNPADGTCYSICMHADPVGTTAASMVAHLRRTRPAVYWASLGNPCCGTFMPLYIDAEIPHALTHAGSSFSGDSVWWMFKRLGECVAEDYEKRTPIVQSAWEPLEAEFRRTSVKIEAETAALRASGRTDHARTRLTRFMSENLDKILAVLHQLLAALENPQ